MRFVTPLRLAAAGLALLLAAALVLWLAPADGYDLRLVDPAHPLGPLVEVPHERPLRDGGAIYFVDVRERQARLLERLLPWTRASGSSLVRTPPVSQVLLQRVGEQDMTDSQKTAAVVALSQLGYRAHARSGGVDGLLVEKGAPAAKVLRPGDLIVAANGRETPTVLTLRAALSRVRPGDRVTIRYRRNGKLHRATITTVADPQNPKRAIVGVSADDQLVVKLPFPIKISVPGVIGPSAGLAFALDILQELGRNVAHGRKVAATGELALNGAVEPIGGVKQKTLGARDAGVDVFLVPAGENAREARRYAGGLRIVAVENFQQALRTLATIGRKQ